MKPINNHLGFGGAALTSLKSYATVKELLNTAYEQGIRHFDTAVLYGRGYSELIYGAFMKGKRKELTITTKFGLGDSFQTGLMPVQLLLPLNYHLKRAKTALSKTVLVTQIPEYTPSVYRQIDRKMIEASFNDSLSRLKTDYVDYYLLHEGLPHFLTDEARDFLLNLKIQGRIRQLGIASNILDIKTLNNEALHDWDVLQYEGNDAEEAVGIMQKFPTKTHFHHSCLRNRNHSPSNGVPLADKVGFMLAQAVKLNPVGKIIFSTRDKDHLEDNMNSFSKHCH